MSELASEPVSVSELASEPVSVSELASEPVSVSELASQPRVSSMVDGPRSLEDVIAVRVREYRQAAGFTVAVMAERVGISKAMLSKIENAQTSCSLTTLARLAAGLEVPVTALFRGVDVEREAVFVPAGRGAQIVRRGSKSGHEYVLLGALRGAHKRMEALLVVLTESSEVFPLFQHAGTELIYMLEGTMVYQHGNARYTMQPGDALQLDGEGAHGPESLVDLPIRFISVTAYGEAATLLAGNRTART